MNASIGQSPIDDSPKTSGFRACQTCKQRKVKCVALPNNDSTCEYCDKHDMQCVTIVQNPKRKRHNTAAELKERVEQLEQCLSRKMAENGGSGKTPSAYDDSLHDKRMAYEAPRLAPFQPESSPRFPQTIQMDNSGTISRPDLSTFGQQWNAPNLLSRDQPFLKTSLPLPNFSNAAMHSYPSSNTYSDSLNCPVTSPSASYSQLRRAQQPVRSPQVREEVHSGAATRSYSPNGRLSTLGSGPKDKVARTSTTTINDAQGEQEFGRHESRQSKIVGPIPAFDHDFYQLCLSKGLATSDNRDCELKDKIWTRFYKLSKDATLPLYHFHFREEVASDESKSNAPAEALLQLETWTTAYGNILMETFKLKIAPRLYFLSSSEIQAISLQSMVGKPVALICAVYALAAQCVSSWSISKRAHLGMRFHRYAMTYLECDLYPVTTEALHILVLLSAFPIQFDTSLLSSWALALAFELRLNIDPQHWQIPDEEKDGRRRLFWIIMVNHRWSAFEHHSPGVDTDYYDTEVSMTALSSFSMLPNEIEVSELIASISRSFYTVRGSKMLHCNTETAATICRQLEQRILESKQHIEDKYTLFDPAIPNSSFGISLAMLHINLELATILIHRPFSDIRKLNLIDSHEHRHKAVLAASNSVSILERMPDAYFTEAWPTHAKTMLVFVTFTLLRESLLSGEAHARGSAKDSLNRFMSIAVRHATRWHLAIMAQHIMSVAEALTGQKYGSDFEIPPDARPSEFRIDPSDFAEAATFEWDDFSQLLGMGSSNRTSDWFFGLGNQS